MPNPRVRAAGMGRQTLPAQLPLCGSTGGLRWLPTPGFTPHLQLSAEDQELPAPCSAQGWC